MFLPEELTERIAKMPPYAGNSKVHRTTHGEDHVFQQHGARLIAGVEMLTRSGKDSEGFVASITLAVDLEPTPARGGDRRRQRTFRARGVAPIPAAWGWL
jgi:hypothetical protein